MEKKEPIKVSLSTVLLVIALIVIIFMAYYIYVEKTKYSKEISILETNKSEMKNTINSLQEKIDTISNTINSNSNEENNNSQTNDISSNEKVKFSNDEIKNCLQEYLDLVGTKEGAPKALLQKLNLINDKDYTDDNATSDGYIKSNIQYSDYKKAMLNYMTEDWFNTRFKNGFKEKDGVLYYFNGGATGMKFEVESITLKGDYSDSAYIAKVYSINIDESKDTENIEFHITNYNGKCVISYCD